MCPMVLPGNIWVANFTTQQRGSPAGHKSHSKCNQHGVLHQGNYRLPSLVQQQVAPTQGLCTLCTRLALTSPSVPGKHEVAHVSCTRALFIKTHLRTLSSNKQARTRLPLVMFEAQCSSTGCHALKCRAASGTLSCTTLPQGGRGDMCSGQAKSNVCQAVPTGWHHLGDNMCWLYNHSVSSHQVRLGYFEATA